jgi:hypothetical protein
MQIKEAANKIDTVVDSGSRAAVLRVLMGVCMILLTMPRVSVSTAISWSVLRNRVAAHAVNLGLANRFEVVLQAYDGRNHVERLQAGMEFEHLAIDNCFRLSASFLRSETCELTACCRSSMS